MRDENDHYDRQPMKRFYSAAAAAAVIVMLTACVAPASRSAGLQSPLDFAAFSGIEQTVQGGPIVRVAYAEVAGDASLSSVSVENGELLVNGRFTAKSNSRWAGVGVLIGAPSAAIDAGGFKALRIRLSAVPGVEKLRLRLTGSDEEAVQSGCYPIFVQAVTPQLTDYEIEFSRFAPERFCGARGVPLTVTVSRLSGVEVVDAAGPGPRARGAVQRRQDHARQVEPGASPAQRRTRCTQSFSNVGWPWWSHGSGPPGRCNALPRNPSRA